MGAQHWQIDMLLFQTLPALGVIPQQRPDCHRIELVWSRKATPGGTPLSACVLTALFLRTVCSKTQSASRIIVYTFKAAFFTRHPSIFHCFLGGCFLIWRYIPLRAGTYKRTAIILSVALSWLIPHQWTVMLSLLSGKEACIVRENQALGQCLCHLMESKLLTGVCGLHSEGELSGCKTGPWTPLNFLSRSRSRLVFSSSAQPNHLSTSPRGTEL